MKKAENALIICTDKRLIGRYERVLREMEIDIDIEYVGNRFGANIEASLNYIDQFREQGKEIIITRGFMAQEIRKKLDFKVMEISVSSFDVLSAISVSYTHLDVYKRQVLACYAPGKERRII